MGKTLFFFVCVWVVCVACEDESPLKRYFDEHQGEYYTVRFFHDSELMGEDPDVEKKNVVNYYKAFYTNAGVLTKWEHYHNQRLEGLMHFVYTGTKLEKRMYYNAKMQKLEEHTYSDKSEHSEVFTYNGSALTSLKRYVNKQADGWWIYYDDSGRILRKEKYSLDRKLGSWLYDYNTNGKLLRERHYNVSGTLIYQYTF